MDRKTLDMSDEPSDDEFEEVELNFDDSDFILEQDGIYESIESEIEAELAELDKEFVEDMEFDE